LAAMFLLVLLWLTVVVVSVVVVLVLVLVVVVSVKADVVVVELVVLVVLVVATACFEGITTMLMMARKRIRLRAPTTRGQYVTQKWPICFQVGNGTVITD